jgi:glycosyltransferase involved in cell wall biosynthesis
LIKLFAFIRRSNADVVHTHCEPSSFYAGLTSRLLRVPTVGTIHRSELRYYVPTWRNRLYYRFLDYYIAVSHERKRRLVSQLWLPKGKVSVLHWGIDLDSIPEHYDVTQMRRKLRLSDGIILFSLGHLGPIKGHEDSIKAMPAIRSRFPEAKLYIAGAGLAEDHERLHALIEKLSLQGVVVLLGQITNSLEWLQACNIFLQPSREEAFGLVFLEAGLCAKPTVSTAVGGIPEIIVDGETGYLVNTLNPDAVAEKVNVLLASEQERLDMGEAARQHICKNFSLTDRIDELERLLQIMT